MSFELLKESQTLVEELKQQGLSEGEADHILKNLLELAVTMYRKGDIKTIKQAHKMELVCQLKKGSRRLTLS